MFLFLISLSLCSDEDVLPGCQEFARLDDYNEIILEPNSPKCYEGETDSTNSFVCYTSTGSSNDFETTVAASTDGNNYLVGRPNYTPLINYPASYSVRFKIEAKNPVTVVILKLIPSHNNTISSTNIVHYNTSLYTSSASEFSLRFSQTTDEHGVVHQHSDMVFVWAPFSTSVTYTITEGDTRQVEVKQINYNPKDGEDGSASTVQGELQDWTCVYFYAQHANGAKDLEEQVIKIRYDSTPPSDVFPPYSIYLDSQVTTIKTQTAKPFVPPGDDDGDGLTTGAIVGIVIGCVVFVALVAFLTYWFACRKKKEVNSKKSSSSSSSSQK